MPFSASSSSPPFFTFALSLFHRRFVFRQSFCRIFSSSDCCCVAIRLEEIVRKENAVPATIALLNGHIRVGLSQDELRRISMPKTDAVKVSRRDLANCLVENRIGGTTVAATIWIAHTQSGHSNIRK
ncbi:hypothetical protein niasHS_001540 [Heterodera schachtii]|uniref:Uncharacterized protein n=1 Tax=Heterodera schachtii TaxID=97005 RepID=A0ABD2KEJ8_HETSC